MNEYTQAFRLECLKLAQDARHVNYAGVAENTSVESVLDRADDYAAFVNEEDATVVDGPSKPELSSEGELKPMEGLWPPEPQPISVSDCDFGTALAFLRGGRQVARSGWNGVGMWLELQTPDEFSKMTLPYIYMHTAQHGLVPWLASQTDLLAEDWYIV